MAEAVGGEQAMYIAARNLAVGRAGTFLAMRQFEQRARPVRPFGGAHMHFIAAHRLAERQRGVMDWDSSVERTLDALARHLEEALDLDRLLEIARAR